MKAKNIPYDFVLDYLLPLEVSVKPMFGMFAVYAGKKIVLLLRERETHMHANGVWIATAREHHESLGKDLDQLTSIPLYPNGITETGWQLLPADADNFETSVVRVCELIVQGDPRIGKIPAPAKQQKKKS